MQNDIKRFLKQEPGNEVFFTTMIDLYALHRDFPGGREAQKLRHDPYRRVEALERAWSDETRDSRFIPFLQLHEFEAYLFSGVPQFAFFFENANIQISALQTIADEIQSPELIDDGQHTRSIEKNHRPIPPIQRLEDDGRHADGRAYWLGEHQVQVSPL